MAGQTRQASFANKDFRKTMCHRHTKWRSRTFPRRLASWHGAPSPNLTRAGLARYNSFQGSYLSGKPAIDPRVARQIHILTWVVSGRNRSGSNAAKPLQGQLERRRDKLLPSHCVCRSFGKTGLPYLARHFSGSFVQNGKLPTAARITIT